MCFLPVDRSRGPCREPTNSPAAAVTDRRGSRAKTSSASRIIVDRLALRRRASSLSRSSMHFGNLNETTRIAPAVLPIRKKGNTQGRVSQVNLDRPDYAKRRDYPRCEALPAKERNKGRRGIRETETLSRYSFTGVSAYLCNDRQLIPYGRLYSGPTNPAYCR
jgi:hypothetical protein